jgi:CubicO group peptidase (beta-lactamase class C family)
MVEEAALEKLLDEAVAEGVVPGAVAVVVDRDGVTTIAAAGARRSGQSLPVTADTCFRLMSMTKSTVTAAALQLVERGSLSLDQTVASVIPRFGELRVIEAFDGDEPRLRPPATQATIRQLMCHTSGLGYPFTSPHLLRYMQREGLDDPFQSDRRVLHVPLVADPGTAWIYGTSIDWLGQVIEAVSGQDLATYMRSNVYEPLGMRDTSFSPSPDQRGRMMTIHERGADGSLVPSDLELPAQPAYWPGGHGVHGTAADYARFMAMLLGDGALAGARVLLPESVELMFTDQLGEIPPPPAMPAVQPRYSNAVPAFPFRQGWGLGLHLALDGIPGMRQPGSGDWAGLCNCYYWVDRAAGIAGALLTQVLPFFDLRIVGLAGAIEQATYAAL